MKKILILTLLSMVSGVVLAQNYSVNEPRVRVNRTASLLLSTTFQTVSFNGTSTINFNTYGTDPATGNKMIWYDATANLFRVYGEYDKNLNVQFFFKTITTALSVGTTLQYRVVIPNGVSPGVDLYFPFPDDGGYGEIATLGLLTVGMNSQTVPLSIYANTALRVNGFYLQVRLSQAITLGTSTLNSAACVITSRY